MTAYIVDAVRTPRGKARTGGGLAWAAPLELATAVVDALAARTGLGEGEADDLILGCATQGGEQGANLARAVALESGLGRDVPGLTVNRFCASGLDAVTLAAARCSAGAADAVVAGGVESISRVPMMSDGGPLLTDAAVAGGAGQVPMGIAADTIATMEGLSRQQLDEYGLRSHGRAAQAWAGGHFDRSLVVLDPPEGEVLRADEHVRGDVTAESMAALPPAFAELGAGVVDRAMLARFPALGSIQHLHTRATSPSLADAAAAALVCSELGLRKLGLEPRARILAAASAGADPFLALTAGEAAARQALARAGLDASQLDLVEFSEAFAATCLRFQRAFDIDDDRFNVDGGMISAGHAFGATGTILVGAAVDGLHRRQGRYGLVAVSGAAGVGSALVLERVA